jgi:hypothetical protein
MDERRTVLPPAEFSLTRCCKAETGQEACPTHTHELNATPICSLMLKSVL